MDIKEIKDLAAAIYTDLAPWENLDTSVEEIFTSLCDDPLIVVKYLVERFIEEV